MDVQLPVRKRSSFFFFSVISLLCWLISYNFWSSHFVCQKAVISHCCLQKTSLGACHSRPSLVWPRWPLQPHFLLPASSMRALSQPNQTAGCSPASVWVPLVFSSLYPSLRNACLFSCPLAKWPTYTSEGDTFSFMRSNHRTLYTFPLSSLSLYSAHARAHVSYKLLKDGYTSFHLWIILSS